MIFCFSIMSIEQLGLAGQPTSVESEGGLGSCHTGIRCILHISCD